MISDWFTDEELISQLKSFFDEEEQENIDFDMVLGTVANVDEEIMQVQVQDRYFRFSNIVCGVVEVVFDE